MKVIMSEDYVRPFGACYKGNVYQADVYASEYYILTDHYGDKFVISESKLKQIASVVVDEPSKVTVNIWHKDITNVAEWLYLNHYASIFASVDEAEASIYRTIYNVLKAQKEALEDNPDTDFAAYAGTAGYHVFFQWEDVDWADICVYVDPSVAIGPRRGVHVVSEGLDTLIEFYQDYKGH